MHMENRNGFSLIACINNKRALGKDNKLLYHIKDDLTHFRLLTTNQVVIMGRKTFESLPNQAPLKNRINIILTINKDFYVDKDKIQDGTEVFIVGNLNELYDILETYCQDKEKFVIGGSSLYEMFLKENLIKRIYLTIVDDDAEGDVYFPKLRDNQWKIDSYSKTKDDSSSLTYQFVFLERKE